MISVPLASINIQRDNWGKYIKNRKAGHVGYGNESIARQSLPTRSNEKMAVKVVVAGDGADESSDFRGRVTIWIFDMQDLAVDETWALESASGRDVSVTRSENGFSFEIDGKDG